MRTRIMGYNFTAQWLKGANNGAADALSHHPHQQPADGDDLAEHEMDTHHSQAAPSLPRTLHSTDTCINSIAISTGEPTPPGTPKAC